MEPGHAVFAEWSVARASWDRGVGIHYGRRGGAVGGNCRYLGTLYDCPLNSTVLTTSSTYIAISRRVLRRATAKEPAAASQSPFLTVKRVSSGGHHHSRSLPGDSATLQAPTQTALTPPSCTLHRQALSRGVGQAISKPLQAALTRAMKSLTCPTGQAPPGIFRRMPSIWTRPLSMARAPQTMGPHCPQDWRRLGRPHQPQARA